MIATCLHLCVDLQPGSTLEVYRGVHLPYPLRAGDGLDGFLPDSLVGLIAGRRSTRLFVRRNWYCLQRQVQHVEFSSLDLRGLNLSRETVITCFGCWSAADVPSPFEPAGQMTRLLKEPGACLSDRELLQVLESHDAED